MHIQLAGPFTENANYQDNILPKYHARIGNDVFFLGTCYSWKNGKIEIVSPERKKLQDGIVLERVPFVRIINSYFTEKLRYSTKVYKVIENYNPDMIMLHDVQSLSDIAICRYLKKHPSTKLIVDCHTDFLNSASNWVSRVFLHGILWKHMALKLNKYAKVFYGTLPARVDFLKNVYKLPPEKCELLVMGADDELVKEVLDSDWRGIIREKYNVGDDEFLVVTGGKILSYRKEVLDLIQAVIDLDNPKIKILFFGLVDDLFLNTFNELKKNNRFIDAGWISSDITYRYMAAADLIVFPGLHSVMWEQAVGMGVPCVFRKLDGFDHVDLGGNAVFIDDISVESIKRTIVDIYDNKDLYNRMKEVASVEGMKAFSYREIAKKCIDAIEKQ